jgi:hypothetical protein
MASSFSELLSTVSVCRVVNEVLEADKAVAAVACSAI